MEELLKYIVTEITGEQPISITSTVEAEINKFGSNEITIFTVTAAKDHMGTLIGKNGRMINSIRTLARTRGAKDNMRVNIELQEQA